MNSHIVFGENNLTAINKTRKSIFEISAVFIVSFVVMFLTMDRTVNIYDEGIILTAAMRVAAGDIIHRDFYANYGPAEFYVVSWLLKAFGHSILPERIFDLSMRAGIATLIYSSLVYYCGRSMAFAATSVCVIWLCTVGNHGYPIYPALLLSLGSTLIMTKAFARNISILYPFVAGTLTGLGALFRYDIGFFAFIANTLAALLILASTRTQIEQISKGALKKITAYAFGAGLPVAVVLFFYFSQSALNSFFHDVVAFPSQYYARTRGLPFPSVSSLFDGLGFILLAIYIPIIIGGMVAIGFFGKQVAGLVSTGDGERAKSFFNEKSVLAIFLTFLVAMFYLKGIVRVSIEHMQLSLLPSIMLLAVLAGIIKKNKILFAAALSVVALSCLATALLSGYKKLAHNHNLVANDLKGFIKASKASGNAQRANSSEASIDPKSMAPFYVEGDRANAVRFIQENTAPGERIYVGLTTHDKVFVNDVSAYFMANRLPITKWHHFDPGLQSSEKIQSEIIDDLEKAKPNYIWLESTWNGVNEPNDSALSSGIKMLDGYILQHYLPAQTFGQIVILRRRG